MILNLVKKSYSGKVRPVKGSHNVGKMIRLKKLVLVAGTVALLAGSIPVAKRAVSPGEMVTEVIDGDSFKIANKQTIRLSSLDAPAPEYCMGMEAKEALEKSGFVRMKVVLDKKFNFM